MKIRDRLPFRQNQNGPIPPDGHEAAPVDAQAEPQNATGPQPVEVSGEDRPDRSGLAGAFEGVAQAVGREINTLQDSVGGLESKLSTRMEVDKRETHEVIETLRKDLLHRFEELRQNQQKALAEIGDKTKNAVVSLRELVERTRGQVDERSEEVREGLHKILTQREHKLAEEMDSISNRLAGLRLDLERQTQASGQVAHLLDDVASVFVEQHGLKKVVDTRTEESSGGEVA